MNKGGDDIISSFINLDSEKRVNILNAAMKEFSQKGYKNASTNEIVKSANISKGLLFHYFSNKKSLFFYLLEYTGEVFLTDFFDKLSSEKTDMITRWRQIVLLKIELIRKYPDLYNFLLSAALDESAEIKQEFERKSKSILDDSYKRVLTNIDTSVFKEGLDEKRVSDMIIWVIQGFSNNELEKLKRNNLAYDVNAIMADFDIYLDLLKNIFYK